MNPPWTIASLKIPRLPFDKFTTASRTLGTQMKATGEVMAIGNSFEAGLMKAIRSLEQHVHSLQLPKLKELTPMTKYDQKLSDIDDERIFVVAEALRRGITPEEINAITKIDIWFLDRIQSIVDMEHKLARRSARQRHPADGQGVGLCGYASSLSWCGYHGQGHQSAAEEI